MEKTLDEEKQGVIDFAKKYNIRIKAKVGLEKHYQSGHILVVFTIKVFRDKKYFTIKCTSEELGFFEDDHDTDYFDNPSPTELYNSILRGLMARLPRGEYTTYEDFLEAFCYEENEKTLLWYKTELDTYKKVSNLFSDLIPELKDLTSRFIYISRYIPSKQKGQQINPGPIF
jgi:uncharacterized protein YneR